MIKSLLAAVNPIMIVCYVFDVILILAAIGLFVWYYIKSSNKNKGKKSSETNISDENIEKINDDTYVIASDEEANAVEEYVQKDNAVEHFVNQISDFNEEANNELTSNAILVKHEVEQPIKKAPRKDEIANYVMIGGVKKEKTEPEKQTTFNRGSDAFKNSTNFLNIIKGQQSDITPAKPAAKPAVNESTSAAAPTKKTTTTRKKSTTTK